MTAASPPLRFGAFIAPFHSPRENPTLSIERDMQLIELLDALDFDEAWIGEHHSAGYEAISSPELFIAAAAVRTRRIRLGTGVNSLSYHHPLILADRIVQLDHQTRGRIMFGAGPGQLPSDAHMMGVDPGEQRRMMGEALECIVALLDGERVSRETDWFKLREAQLQIRPYQHPRMEVAVACAVTPNGPATAGRGGFSMLSVAASSQAGFEALPSHWATYAAEAGKAGRAVTRDSWRVVTPIYVAESYEAALAEASAQVLPSIVDYISALGGTRYGDAFKGVTTGEEAIKIWTTQGLGPFGVLTIGSPDDIETRIRTLQAQSGGFGTFLMLAHNAATWDATRRSYELFARHVMPRFKRSNNLQGSLDWVSAQADQLGQTAMAATARAIQDHVDKTGAQPAP